MSTYEEQFTTGDDGLPIISDTALEVRGFRKVGGGVWEKEIVDPEEIVIIQPGVRYFWDSPRPDLFAGCLCAFLAERGVTFLHAPRIATDEAGKGHESTFNAICWFSGLPGTPFSDYYGEDALVTGLYAPPLGETLGRRLLALVSHVREAGECDGERVGAEWQYFIEFKTPIDNRKARVARTDGR